ncbi:MAG: alkaline phosphatase family protein [Acidobacteriaceae bacterium]
MNLPSSNIAALGLAALALCATALPQHAQTHPKRHNVIIFVADGLRRGSVNAQDMPTFLKVRQAGVDFRNSHAVFPTFTTSNASVIATGHGLGDTGDFSNTIYPGIWVANPKATATAGSITPFLENDEVLADLNAAFHGNYLGERTLLSLAREKGFAVASVGKLGPTAIQQIEAVHRNGGGALDSSEAIIVDDSTGHAGGLPLPKDVVAALEKAQLPPEAPTRSNGFAENSSWNNNFQGDAKTPGTKDANRVQEQWMADVATKVLLPKFSAEGGPFLLLFWSRDPDGTQHNEGDSLQQLTPGINGPTAQRGLRNADHCLKQLLDWLDAHPGIKANTDVVITSDHGFATISRREIARDGASTVEGSATRTYALGGAEQAQPRGTLPTGFLAVDLALRERLHMFDSAVRSSSGSSVYKELKLNAKLSEYPSNGSALLGETVKRADGSDARLIVAANGGSDLVYVPSKSAEIVRQILKTLTQLDYVGGIFADDAYCPTTTDCPGALPLSAIGLAGASRLPRPAIVVTYKVFYSKLGDLQSAAQISDTRLQEGQGMHGGFGRDQTLNNMAALGPDFKRGFVDESPMGNIDIVPTLAHVLGFELPSVGTLRGRVLTEALIGTRPGSNAAKQTLTSQPAANGMRTVLEYEEFEGVRYAVRACALHGDAKGTCW